MTLTASSSDAELYDSSLLLSLRRAGSVIDSMWHRALADGHADSAVQLGEASQGVHRALIALTALERSSLPD